MRLRALCVFLIALTVLSAAVFVYMARDARHVVLASRPQVSVPHASPRPSTLPALRDLRVHQWAITTLRVKVDEQSRTEGRVCIVIATPAGRTLRRLYLPRKRPAGSAMALRYRVDLEPARYTYRAVAVDAGGRRTKVARSGEFVVLRPLQSPFPTAANIAAAGEFAAERSGRAAVAVVDRYGRLHGYLLHTGFQSASLVKVMLLSAYLREHASIPEDMLEKLTAMIEHSSNAAAYAVYDSVGDAGLRSVAKLAHMQDYAKGSSLLATRVSAADYAELMYNIRAYLPARHEALAMNLLSHIVYYECWGLPAVARPCGWTVWFKGGWLGANTTVHQAALLQKGHITWALAVLTDGDPTPTYGRATLQGVMSRLLGVAE